LILPQYHLTRMRNDFYAEWCSHESGRTVIVADEGDSVWAYLTQSGSLRIERDCWLFNTASAATDPDLEHYRAASLPPPAPATIVTAAGVLAEPQAGRWNVRWSDAGDAAAVVLDGVDVGVMSVSEPRGMSRHLLEAGPWGRPWDAHVVARLGLGE
jgi:hypothetical protein